MARYGRRMDITGQNLGPSSSQHTWCFWTFMWENAHPPTFFLTSGLTKLLPSASHLLPFWKVSWRSSSLSDLPAFLFPGSWQSLCDTTATHKSWRWLFPCTSMEAQRLVVFRLRGEGELPEAFQTQWTGSGAQDSPFLTDSSGSPSSTLRSK